MESAPVDIFSAIFLYVNDSDDIVRMFLTGSRMMQFKITHYVRSVSGIYQQMFTNFLNLRELDLSLDGNIAIQTYPANLTKLIIVGNNTINDSHLLNIPKQLTHLNISRCINIRNFCDASSLEHLDVSHCCELKTLLWIDNLQYLDASYCTNLSSLTIPKNLAYLNINASGVKKSNLIFLPTSLQTFLAHTLTFTKDQIAKFPDSLETVDVSVEKSELFPKAFILPNNITSLVISGCHVDGLMIIPSSVVKLVLKCNSDLPQLPSSITDLSINMHTTASLSFAQKLSENINSLAHLKRFYLRHSGAYFRNTERHLKVVFNLPETLVELEFYMPHRDISYKIPKSTTSLMTDSNIDGSFSTRSSPETYPNLKYAHFICVEIDPNFVNTMPNLESLIIERSLCARIKTSDLPRSLTHLRDDRSNVEHTYQDFPQNLRFLRIECNAETEPDFKKLPKSLRELSIHFTHRNPKYALNLGHLDLETLHIYGYQPPISSLPPNLKHLLCPTEPEIWPKQLVTYTGPIETAYNGSIKMRTITRPLPKTLKKIVTERLHTGKTKSKYLPHLIVKH
jgi:hypothetical protein